MGKIYLFFIFVLWSHWLRAQSFPCVDGAAPDEYIIRLNIKSQTLASKMSVLKKKNFDISRWSRINRDLKPHQFSFKTQQKISEASSSHIFLAQLTENQKIQLLEDPDILSTEPNCYIRMFSEGDPLRAQQWSLNAVHFDEIQGRLPALQSVIVAVSDTGIDLQHEDLKDQLWINELEFQGQEGIDDDGNGFIDDLHGADFADHDGDPRPGPMPGSEHGTHVSGIIGATANNAVGITGIASNVKIMAIKSFKNEKTVSTLADLIAGLYYAIENKAHIINCSWGTRRPPSLAEQEVMNLALRNHILVVVAAGNSAEAASEYSPASIPGMLVVGSSNQKGELSSFSNFGSIVTTLAPGGERPLLAQPAEYILSTIPNTDGKLYGGLYGTSMAAPFVTGVAALLKGLNPQKTPEEIIQEIKNGSDIITSRTSIGFVSQRKLNLLKTLSPYFISDANQQDCKNDCLTQVNAIQMPQYQAPEFSGSCNSFPTNNKNAGLPLIWSFLFLPIGLNIYFRRK